MGRNILVFGGTGFVGTSVVRELILNNFTPIIVYRKSSKIPTEFVNKAIFIQGDVSNPSTFQNELSKYNIEGIIYMIGLIKETKHAKFIDAHFNWFVKIMQWARARNIQRIIYLSANGTKSNGTKYQTTKWQAEKFLSNSNFVWTIVKPSLVWGDSDRYNFRNVIKGLIRFRIVPIVGDGKYRLQPIERGQLAKTIVNTIDFPSTIGQKLCVGGQVYTFEELIDFVAKQEEKRIFKIHIPVFVIKVIIKLFGWLPGFPIESDQLDMLLEENVCN